MGEGHLALGSLQVECQGIERRLFRLGVGPLSAELWGGISPECVYMNETFCVMSVEAVFTSSQDKMWIPVLCSLEQTCARPEDPTRSWLTLYRCSLSFTRALHNLTTAATGFGMTHTLTD